MERNRVARNRLLIFREALQLHLIIVALWSACADEVMICCGSQCNVTRYRKRFCVYKRPKNAAGQSGIHVWFYNSSQLGVELKNKQLKK